MSYIFYKKQVIHISNYVLVMQYFLFLPCFSLLHNVFSGGIVVLELSPSYIVQSVACRCGTGAVWRKQVVQWHTHLCR